MKKQIWWSALEETGLEHLFVRRSGENFIAASTIFKLEDGKPFEVFYRIEVDSAWRVCEVEILLHHSEPHRLLLFADGTGNWKDGDRKNLPEFSGCLDVDISATPFTNTLPIKRSALKIGEAIDISVVYFLIPEMSVQRSEQRYTRLGNDLYRFEENGLFAGFTADLRFDNEGFVIEYPELFRRIES